MPYRLNLLGEPRIEDSDGMPVDFPRGKPLALLSYLAVERRPVPRTELGELLWPNAPQKRTRHSVRQAIWLIRRTLGDEVLLGDDPVSVSGDVLSCDLVEFEGALGAGQVDHARSRWRGPLLFRMSLSGCRGWDHWLEEARSRIERGLFQGLLSQVGSGLLAPPGERALEYLDEALALNPFSVEAQRLRIETFLEMGDFSRARKALEEALHEVGDDPRIREELNLLQEKIDRLDARVESSAVERLGESVEFVGRAGELADLRGAWKRARTGYSSAACILGPTGIGKTRLANELLSGIERDGGAVARAKGFRGEHRIPWGSVADLIQELMTLPGAKGISSGSDAVIRSVLPSMATNEQGAVSSNGPGEVHSAAMADAVADLVEAVGFEAPLAVFLDDWQWVDKESRALFGKVFRRVRGLPCLFLIAERTGVRRLLQESAESLVGDLGGRRIALAPLDMSELDELLALLAEFEDPTETTTLVRRLHRITGGNPLFVGEVLRKLAGEGIYELAEGRWIIRAGKLSGELDLPESVQSLIRERLERLSPTAGQVVAALAKERRSVSAPVLRRRAGLDEAVFTRVVGELIDREVVEWVGPTEVDFTHDQLREAAGLSRLPPQATGLAQWIRRYPLPTAMGGTILLLAIVGGASALGFGPWGNSGNASATDHRYPFGRGRVILRGDTLVEAIPPAQEGGGWILQPSDLGKPTVPPSRIFGPFKTPAGRIRWLGNEISNREAPPRTVEFHADGTSTVYVETSGDDGFKDLAPSGDVGLVMSEDSRSPTYRQNLVRVDEPEMDLTVLYRPEEMLFGSDWSPDGQKIATVLMGNPDTLLVLTPMGTEVVRLPFPEFTAVQNPVWCADSRQLTITATLAGPNRGFLLDTADGSLREFGEGLFAVSWPLCLGNGEAVVFHGITEEGAWVFLEDVRNGARQPLLRTTPGEVWRSIWLPDEAPAPVWEIDIIGGERTLDWGSSLSLEVRGIRTDGTPGPTSVEWTSSNPGVASVGGGGTVTGNRVGQAVITATHAGWVRDSVRVSVREAMETPGEVLFREMYEGDDGMDAWVVSDSTFPVPAVMQREGETVLSLRGEGRYRDPIFTRDRFSLQLGVTLELEFLLPLNRDDRQRVIACLKGRASQPDSLAQGTGRYDREFCFQYPSTELSKRKSDVFRVSAGDGYFSYEESAAPELPSDDWTHLALQVRSDGTYKIFVNRFEFFEFQNPWGIDPTLEWRIELAGASLDTELLIRNLTLWRGERFGVDAPDPMGTSGSEGGGSPASSGGPDPADAPSTEPSPRSRR